MSLKLTLKPGDSVLIGEAHVENLSRNSSTLLIRGDVPVLRGELAVDMKKATDAPMRLRHVLQRMYLDGNVAIHHETYFKVVSEILTQFPAAVPFITETNRCLMTGDVYRAIKLAKQYLSELPTASEQVDATALEFSEPILRSGTNG